jgi:hypothetical protein
MNKHLWPSIALLCILPCLPAQAEPVRQLLWDDLIPARLLSEDPLANLPQEQQDLVIWVLNTLETLPERGPETEEYYQEIDKAMPDIKAAGIDIDKLLANRKEFQTAVVEALNGQRVRLPGFLLPLEVSGDKVTEFLLVPYVGACIHVPPPPQNQIVHVKIDHKEGFKTSKLFEPVWVTGVITAEAMVKELYLVDGSAGINIGYAMEAERVEPYKE